MSSYLTQTSTLPNDPYRPGHLLEVCFMVLDYWEGRRRNLPVRSMCRYSWIKQMVFQNWDLTDEGVFPPFFAILLRAWDILRPSHREIIFPCPKPSVFPSPPRAGKTASRSVPSEDS